MPGAEVVRDVLRRVAQLLAAWPHPSAIIGGTAITARVLATYFPSGPPSA